MRRWKTSLLLLLLSASIYADNTNAHDEASVLKARVPPDKLPMAKATKNPLPAGEKSVTAGKELYFGKGACASCHGDLGKGDGPTGQSFDPRPRNFTDIEWQAVRTDGEIFWAIAEGTEFGMIAFGDNLSEEERWQLVNYIRSLGKSMAPMAPQANHVK